MQRLHVGGAALMLAIAACADPVSNARASDDAQLDEAASAVLSDQGNNGASGGRTILVLDDCDPNDPAWAPTGGCALKRGQVTEAEFGLLLGSALSASVVGHPAWRNEPSYLRIDAGQEVRVRNEGGRFHTFTNVALFGGGRIPPLNQGLTLAPECALAPGAVDPNGLVPGGRFDVNGLAVGDHRFQCCIHPWMRALVKVQAN
ncbi:MAG: cupredoxin domain-containing protein [Gemmatimonadaceae bacterium]